MNSKQVRKYELIIAIAAMQSSDTAIPTSLAELCAIDFETAFEMWEFILARHTPPTTSPENIITKPFTMFLRISEMKTRQLFCESLPLQKLVYGTTAAGEREPCISFLTNLILGGKIEIADECLTKLRTNPQINFNETMRIIVDDIFKTYCARHNVKVPVINRKQKMLLLSHIEKVRGPNKALLTQRLKEL